MEAPKMAPESRRAPRHKSLTEDEEKSKRDRWVIILFGVGGILIVVGIILLSKFLSGQ